MDWKFFYIEHIDQTYAKTRAAIHNLSAIGKRCWGANSSTLPTIFKGAVIPILAYAYMVWRLRSAIYRNALKLIGAHRCGLIRIAKAYFFASTDTLLGITGLSLVDLRLKQLYASYCINWGTTPVNCVFSSVFQNSQPFHCDDDYYKRVHPTQG